MKRLILFLGMFLILFSNLSLAIDCDKSFIFASYEQGQQHSETLYCTNSDNNSVSIIKSGDFQIDQNIIDRFSSKTINITFNPNSPIGFNNGKININSTEILVFFEVEEMSIPQGCIIDIFPSILSNIKVQQGEKKTRNIQLSVPACYESSISVNGVTLQSDEKPIQLGEISIGTIQPGNSIMIPIEIDATDVSTGSYSDTLQFLLYDNLGNKINVNSVSISTLVTQGIQPIVNFSLTSLPVCSISAIDLGINQTYTLTCSRTNPNIVIEPMIDFLYISGLSVSETSSQYIYSFEPKIIGETIIGAKFKYKNAELGNPYIQNVRISPSGNSPTSGITTIFKFYQGTEKKVNELTVGETIIRVSDNSTGNYLDNYKLYLNGIETNNTLILDSGKQYELRSSIPGYLDNVINFTVSSTPLTLVITPNKEIYFVGDTVNITSINGTKFYLDGSEITSPYVFKSSGEKLLEVKKEGYISINKTLKINNRVTLDSKSCTLEWEKWKTGKEVECSLTESANWSVTLNNTIISEGYGQVITFEMEEEGKLEIKADDTMIWNQTIEKGGVINWIKENWLISAGILLLVFGGIYFIFIRGSSSEGYSEPLGSAE